MSRKDRRRQSKRDVQVVQLATSGRSGKANTGGTSSTSARAYQQASLQAQNSAWQSADMRERQPGGHPYPEMEKVPDNKPLLTSLGATGTAIFGGIITSEEYNEDFYWKDGIVIYEQMSRADAQPIAITQLLELPIRRATWSIEPASEEARDKEVASLIESCLFHDMRYQTTSGRIQHQKWDDTLRHILMMLRFGFMAFEVNWRIDDGWVKWARWTPLLPRTVWRWWVGDDNELVGIQQWTFKDYNYQFVDIPADKLLLFVHRQEGQNYEGVSIFRAAYKHWWMKEQYYKVQAIDIERNAISVPVIYLPENFTSADITMGQQILANLRANESMGATLPPGWKLEYANMREKGAAPIQQAIDHHDLMIARSVLGQFLNLGASGHGAYNLDNSQKMTLLAALQAECEYIEDVINSDAIPRLVDYNYDGVENYPKLKASKLIAQEIDLLAEALEKLANIPNNALIHPDAELEDFLRNAYGLPKAPVSVVEANNPTAPSNPERPETSQRDDTAPGDNQESKDVTPGGKPNAKGQAGQDAQDTADTVGAVGDGEAASMAEARLLREALQVIAGIDVVERGALFLDQDSGKTQQRDSHGRYAPEGASEHEHEGRGRGGQRGGAARGARGQGVARGGAGGERETQPRAPRAPRQPREPTTTSRTRQQGGQQRGRRAQGSTTAAHDAQVAHGEHAQQPARRRGRQRTQAEEEHIRARAEHRVAQRELATAGAQMQAHGSAREASRREMEVRDRVRESIREEAIAHGNRSAPARAARIAALRQRESELEQETARRDAERQQHIEAVRRETEANGRSHYNPDTSTPTYRAYARANTAYYRAESERYRVRNQRERLEDAAAQRAMNQNQFRDRIDNHPDVVAAHAATMKAEAEGNAIRERFQRASERAQHAQERLDQAEVALDIERGGGGHHLDLQNGSREELHNLFGRDLSRREIAGLVGAPPGAHVTVSIGTNYRGQSNSGSSQIVNIALRGQGYHADRELYRDAEGHLVMHNAYFRVEESQHNEGIGTRIFSEQVHNLSVLGVHRIEVETAGGGRGPGVARYPGEYNGYYTWARLGYNGKVSVHEIARNHRLSRDEVPASIRGARTIHQIMRTPEGRQWWKDYGQSWEGSFLLARNSANQRVLKDYLAEREKRGKKEDMKGVGK